MFEDEFEQFKNKDEKLLSDEEIKKLNLQEFLDTETTDLVAIIGQLEKRRERGDKGGIGETIGWVNEAKRLHELNIKNQRRDLKKWTPEELDNELASISAKIEEIKPDLEDFHKSTIAKQKIDDLELRERIIQAIKDERL